MSMSFYFAEGLFSDRCRRSPYSVYEDRNLRKETAKHIRIIYNSFKVKSGIVSTTKR